MTEENQTPQNDAVDSDVQVEHSIAVESAPDAVDSMIAEIEAQHRADKKGQETGTEAPKKDVPAEKEEEAAPEVEDTTDDEEQEEDQEIEEPVQKKKKPNEIERLRKKNSEKDESIRLLTERTDAAERRNAELEKLVLERLKGGDEEAESEDEEPLDTVTHDKLNKLEQKITTDRFMDAVAQQDNVGAQNDKGWDLRKKAIIEHDIIEAIDRGRATNEAEAEKIVRAELLRDLAIIHKNGGSMVDYINRRSRFVLDKYQDKESVKEKTSQKGIDVVALDKHRKATGAPTNKVSGTVAASGDLVKDIEAAYRAERKAAREA